MSKEAYVHNEVTLICTNGFKPANLLVKDRGVRLSGGKLMATEEDKPTNFACKWAGVLAAIIAAFAIAAPFIVAVLAVFLIGMLAALTLGQLLCWVALKGSKWTNVHPMVKLKGQRALTENSKLTCGVFSGDITIFYDEATANRALHNNWLRNSVEILGAAFMGRAIGIAIGEYGWYKGFIYLVKQVPLNLIYGYGIIEGSNVITNATTGNGLTDGIGNSIPYYGENKNAWDIIQDDYQKPFTRPIDVTTESDILTDGKVQKAQGQLNQHEQNQVNQYKQDNPIHKYGRGKKSPHYGRQQQQQQKLDSRAKRYGASQRLKIAQRYLTRVRTTAQKNYTHANYGLLSFFALSEVLSQHLEKSLANELQKNNTPEN